MSATGSKHRSPFRVSLFRFVFFSGLVMGIIFYYVGSLFQLKASDLRAYGVWVEDQKDQPNKYLWWEKPALELVRMSPSFNEEITETELKQVIATLRKYRIKNLVIEDGWIDDPNRFLKHVRDIESLELNVSNSLESFCCSKQLKHLSVIFSEESEGRVLNLSNLVRDGQLDTISVENSILKGVSFFDQVSPEEVCLIDCSVAKGSEKASLANVKHVKLVGTSAEMNWLPNMTTEQLSLEIEENQLIRLVHLLDSFANIRKLEIEYLVRGDLTGFARVLDVESICHASKLKKLIIQDFELTNMHKLESLLDLVAFEHGLVFYSLSPDAYKGTLRFPSIPSLKEFQISVENFPLLEFLKNNSQIQQLEVSSMKLNQWEFLGLVPELRRLEIFNCSFENLNTFNVDSQLESLTMIGFDTDSIPNVGCFARFSQLKKLKIQHVQGSQMLEKLHRLQKLTIFGMYHILSSEEVDLLCKFSEGCVVELNSEYLVDPVDFEKLENAKNIDLSNCEVIFIKKRVEEQKEK